jgi:hypothetical protein
MATINSALFVIFAGVTSIALLIAVDLILPKAVERTRQKLETSPMRCFVLGLINLLFWVAVLVIYFVWSQSNGGPDMVTYLIGTAMLILLLIAVIIPGIPALAAFAQIIGTRMGGEGSRLKVDARGGLLLVLAGLTPYVGWLVFTPVLVSTAVGAGLLTFFQRKAAPSPGV